MVQKVVDKKDLIRIKSFFNDIRFYMSNSVFDGVMGEAYVDDILNPKIAFLVVRKFCFISGNAEDAKLEKIINQNFKGHYLILNNDLSEKFEKIYGNTIIKQQRYSIKKNPSFDLDKLSEMGNKIENGFKIVQIDEELADLIRKQKFLGITDNYKKNGVGFSCIYKNEIVGVATSNIFYEDGIEVNIKVSENYRRKGIAAAMASKLILECLNQGKKISWDAANMNSVRLAEKLGFKYDSTYNIYSFPEEQKTKKLIIEIEELIKDSNEEVSILIKNLNSENDVYSFNGTEKIVAASTIKVPIMLAILDEVRKKNINLNDSILVPKNDILYETEVFEDGENYYSVYELMNWMIIQSDNTATNALVKKIGMEKINDFIINILKVKSTYIERYMMDENAKKQGLNNYTSQKDMFDIFSLLFNKKILTDELCDVAIKTLYNQRCQDQIMRYIFEPIKFAHKTGSLDYLNHDVGVMNINGKLLYIGVSIYNSNNKEGNRSLTGSIGKEVYSYLLK